MVGSFILMKLFLETLTEERSALRPLYPNRLKFIATSAAIFCHITPQWYTSIMSNIKLLIASANDKFTISQISSIEKAAELAEKFISKNFDFNYEVNVIVVPNQYLFNIIPEDGISGRTYKSDMIVISVNTELEIPEDFFYETLCHELSHSIRWKKVPERSITLFENIILEGLAIILEEKAMTDEKKNNSQYFLKEMQKTNKVTIDKILSVLENNLDDITYDYNKIFIDGDENFPRWSGYRLGYYFVKKHLQDKNININKATLESYKKFSK